MAEVVDIVTRLSYQTETGELKKALATIQEQSKTIGILEKQIAKLEQMQERAASSEVSSQKRISDSLQKVKAERDKALQSLKDQIQANKDVQRELEKERQLIGRLERQVNTLQSALDKAMDKRKIEEYNKQLERTNATLRETEKTGIGSRLMQSVLQGFGIGTGIALLQTGVTALKEFVSTASRLAAEMEGVETAFNRISQPNLLEGLREATRGTVSDLELMKQAVQFSNFGLPIDKLAQALSFARVRARETGVSVDYLVQSIVTGIGRQSPLILDNLGINAKRVSEEFKRTGDFAQAAFKIISEESAKAGKDIETFAEKQARINAQIENTQAAFGRVINSFKGYLISVGQSMLEGSTRIRDEYVKNVREQSQAARDQQQLQANANILFLQGFQDYLNRYRDADFKTREDIKNNARNYYEQQLQWANEFYKDDLRQLEFYLQSLQIAYQRFNAGSAKAPINIKMLTPGLVRGLTQEQLLSIQESINLSRSSLSANDTIEINRLNALSRAVKAQLDIIAGTTAQNNFKNAEGAAKKYQQALEGLRKEVQKLARAMRNPEMSELESAADDISVSKTSPYIEKLKESFDKQLAESSGGGFADNPARLNAQLELQRDIRGKQEKDDKEADDKRKKAIKSIVQSYQTAAELIIQSIQYIHQAQINLLDEEIQIRRDRVSQAVELAERGNAEILKSEQERLNEAQKKREEIARKQLQLNALLQASSAALSATQAIQTVTNAGASGDPYSTPARIAAAVAALAAGFAFVTSLMNAFKTDAFAEGVVDYKGNGTTKSDSNMVRISKGESVITAEATQKYKPILEAMNKGIPLPYTMVMPSQKGNDISALKKEFSLLREAFEMSGIKVQTNVSNGQIYTIVERQRQIEQRRWS